MGNGRGKTLKQAKSRAAMDLINKLEGKVPRCHMNERRPPVVRSCFKYSVCRLHNYCIQQDINVPRYSTPIAPWVAGKTVTICRCGSFSATGYGSNRKTARDAAARGVITQMEARFGISIA